MLYLKLLNAYLRERIRYLNKSRVGHKSKEEMSYYRGAISELQEIKQLIEKEE